MRISHDSTVLLLSRAIPLMMIGDPACKLSRYYAVDESVSAALWLWRSAPGRCSPRRQSQTVRREIRRRGAGTASGRTRVGRACRPASVRPSQAPTLLIVGGADDVVIDLNREAMQRMQSAQVELEIVPGATHLFEEPGTLEEVSLLALAWCRRYLSGARP